MEINKNFLLIKVKINYIDFNIIINIKQPFILKFLFLKTKKLLL